MKSNALIESVKILMSECDQDTVAFAQASGVKCPEGCGHCCEYPEIEVSVLDCLPMAEALCEKGLQNIVLEKIKNQASQKCPVFISKGPGKGSCGHYAERPGVCRLFGFAGRTGKNGEKQWSACGILKELPQPQNLKVMPLFEKYQRALFGLNPSIGSEMFSIPKALVRAMEWVQLRRSYEAGESD